MSFRLVCCVQDCACSSERKGHRGSCRQGGQSSSQGSGSVCLPLHSGFQFLLPNSSASSPILLDSLPHKQFTLWEKESYLLDGNNIMRGELNDTTKFGFLHQVPPEKFVKTQLLLLCSTVKTVCCHHPSS